MRKFAFSLLLLAACSGQNQAPLSANGSPGIAIQSEPALKDTADVAEARKGIVAGLQRSKATALSKVKGPDSEADRALIERIFDRAINGMSNTPVDSVDQLREVMVKTMLAMNLESMAATRSRLAAKLPQRINPEPEAGEKREAVDPDGKCTNDLIVDVRRFEIQSIDASMKITRVANSGSQLASLHMQDAANTLIHSCDTVVDRYGDKAECEMPGQEEKHKMANFAEACKGLRGQIKKMLDRLGKNQNILEDESSAFHLDMR